MWIDMCDCVPNRTWIGNLHCIWKKRALSFPELGYCNQKTLSYEEMSLSRQRAGRTYMYTWGRGQGLQQSSTMISQKQEDHSHKATVVHKKNRSKHYLRDATTPLNGWGHPTNWQFPSSSHASAGGWSLQCKESRTVCVWICRTSTCRSWFIQEM